MVLKCSVCTKPIFSVDQHVCSGKKPVRPRALQKCPHCDNLAGANHVCPNDPSLADIDAKSPLTALYRKGRGQIYPMNRWQPKGMEVIATLNGTGKMGKALSCTEDMLKRLVTALAFVEKESRLSTCVANRWTIMQFMELSSAFQMQIINQLWDECTVQKAHEQVPMDMTEFNDEVAKTVAQLPSSVRPDSGPKGPFVKGPFDIPFTSMGIGFRVDGTLSGNASINSIARVGREGMTAQAMNASFMLNVRKMLVTETTIATDTSKARVYVQAQDLFNETAVCVSRSFFGATAFPERTTDDQVALWAVDCSDLRGFDTEAHQITAKAKPWRPGEKCFPRIPAKNVIGYVTIKRSPAGNGGANGGWKFTVPLNAKWTYVNVPVGEKKRYLEEELAAWATGIEYTVSGDYDFVS